MGQFERGGYVFDVREGGDPTGAPVVLLHGFPQDGGCWSDVAALLQRDGYKTLALDMRGVSPGARPATVGEYRTVESVNDVVAMLDAFGIERAHIVGHDWGGFIAWATGCAHPDRVLTLASLSTPHFSALQHSLRHSTQALRSWYIAMFQVPFLAERLLTPGTPVWRRLVRGLPQQYVQSYAQRMADPAARRAALSWYRVLPREMAAPSVEWTAVDLPTMYVWGERDPALSRAAAEATKDYVTGPYRFEAINAGHWIPETRPVLLAALLLEHLGQA